MRRLNIRPLVLTRCRVRGELARGLVVAALALLGCSETPQTYLPGEDGSVRGDWDGGTGGDLAALAGLPCEVGSLLKTYCLGCHGEPPKGAPMALASYSDLVAMSPAMPTQSAAERALVRMQDPTSPMPPGAAPTVPANQLAAFKAWITAGMPPGSCQPPLMDLGLGADLGGRADLGVDPLDSAPKCTSGKTWTGGNKGDPTMHPGRACTTCHAAMRGPNLSIAGTVYPSGHEPDDCVGGAAMGGITVEITDKSGKVFTLPVNTSGNFTLTPRMGTLQLPYYAKVKQGARVRAMGAAQMSGDCNSCHTQTGASGAPGRITLPY